MQPGRGAGQARRRLRLRALGHVLDDALRDGETSALQQPDHLGSGHEHRPVAVLGQGTPRPVVIVGGIEREARANAGVLHLTLVVDLGRHRIPAELGGRPVGHGADPPAVDGPGHAEHKHGRGGGLEIGVVTVEQLVPQARAGLAGGQTPEVGPELIEHGRTARMILGQNVEQLDHRHGRPAIRARPVEFGVIVRVRGPTVQVEAPLPVEHAGGKLEHLPHGVVVIAALAREFSHLGQRGNAHVHVVQPQRLRLRVVPGQRAVGETELPVTDVLHVGVDHGHQVRTHAGPARLDQRRAHGAGIVERRGGDQVPELKAAHLGGRGHGAGHVGRGRAGGGEIGLILQADERQPVGNELESPHGEGGEACVAGDLARQQHGRIGHAFLVADQREEVVLAPIQHGVGIGFAEIGDFRARPAVDDPHRAG